MFFIQKDHVKNISKKMPYNALAPLNMHRGPNCILWNVSRMSEL